MIVAINTESDGTARTIKSQYYKNGFANLANDNKKGGKYACTGAVVSTHNRISECYRIRKLTPKECWRLMAFTDEDFHKAEQVNSNTQLYKQAGNSIVVAVLEAIFRQMCIQNIPTWNEEKGAQHD